MPSNSKGALYTAAALALFSVDLLASYRGRLRLRWSKSRMGFSIQRTSQTPVMARVASS